MEPPTLSTHELPRKLGLLDATMIVIGSGIFLLPNLIARELSSGFAILSAWIISGVLSFFGALAYAELGSMMPAGGQYVYLREAYGPLAAFVCGWTFMLAVLSGGTAWLAVTFSIYVGQFVSLTPIVSKVVSLALIALLSAVNYIGVKEGAWVQDIFTFLKIAGLLVLIGAAFSSSQSASPVHTRLPRLPSSCKGFGMPSWSSAVPTKTLFTYSILAAWIFYTMSVAAVFFLRRKLPDAPRPYKMLGYPYTLWTFILVSVWFVVNAFVTQPQRSLMALVIIATGIAASLTASGANQCRLRSLEWS